MGITAQTFISRNGGLFSLGRNGQRKPFAFGKELMDGISRRPPYEHSGLAAIDARCQQNKGKMAEQYRELVSRIAININGKGIDVTDAKAYLLRVNEEVRDPNFRNSDFIYSIPVGRGADLFTLLIYDVLMALDAKNAGIAIADDGIKIMFSNKRMVDGKLEIVHRLAYVEKLQRNGKPLDKVCLACDPKPASIDGLAPIYDAAQLQSALCVLAANEKAMDMEFDLAISLDRKALALCPENADAHCGIASALLELGKNDEALAESLLAESLEPYLGRAHGLAGTALGRMGRNDEAIESYLKAIRYTESKEKRATYHHNIAVSCLDEGRLNDAKNACDRCLSIEPGSVDALKLRSHIYGELGMHTQADEDMRLYEKLMRGKGKANP